jgi:hypothetical protein
MELVNGTKRRISGQLDIWSAVFGPLGPDGYVTAVFDPKTGVNDHSVAMYWREHFGSPDHLNGRSLISCFLTRESGCRGAQGGCEPVYD